MELEIEKNCSDILIDFGPCMDNTIDYCDNEFTIYHTDITQISITTEIDDKHKQNLTITRDAQVCFSENANDSIRRHEVEISDSASFLVIDILEKFIDKHESETIADDNNSVTIEYEKATGNNYKKDYNLNSNYKTICDRIRRLHPLYNLYLLDGQNLKEPVLSDDDICFVYEIIEKTVYNKIVLFDDELIFKKSYVSKESIFIEDSFEEYKDDNYIPKKTSVLFNIFYKSENCHLVYDKKCSLPKLIDRYAFEEDLVNSIIFLV